MVFFSDFSLEFSLFTRTVDSILPPYQLPCAIPATSETHRSEKAVFRTSGTAVFRRALGPGRAGQIHGQILRMTDHDTDVAHVIRPCIRHRSQLAHEIDQSPAVPRYIGPRPNRSRPWSERETPRRGGRSETPDSDDATHSSILHIPHSKVRP